LNTLEQAAGSFWSGDYTPMLDIHQRISLVVPKKAVDLWPLRIYKRSERL